MKLAMAVIASVVFCRAAAAAPAKIIRHSQGVPQHYIVVLAEHVAPAAVHGIARSLTASYNVTLKTVWPDAPRGFLAAGDEANFAAMSDDPRVKYIEQDARLAPPTSRVSSMYFWWPTPENHARKWHIDRIDDAVYTTNSNTYLMCPEGHEVTAYVIDRGVYLHKEFETSTGHRLIQSLNFVRHEVPATAPYPAVDTVNGCVNDLSSAHGTSVASLLAGDGQGSSHAKIVSLRVHSCGVAGSSFSSDVLSAIQWLSQRPPTELAVVNWSGFAPPGDEQFQAISDGVAEMVRNTNMPFITAAGNFSTDACKFSPQNRGYNPVSRPNGEVLVVGASGIGPNNADQRWQDHDQLGRPLKGESTGSNAGDCVGIYAPGKDVMFAVNTSSNQLAIGTGTSYASPIVAGVAARYVSEFNTQHGRKPTYTEVYHFLTTNSYATVNNANSFLPTYWVCLKFLHDGNFRTTTYDSNPGSCGDTSTDKGPFKFEVPALPAPYAARMLYWDPSDAGPGWICEGEYLEW